MEAGLPGVHSVHAPQHVDLQQRVGFELVLSQLQQMEAPNVQDQVTNLWTVVCQAAMVVRYNNEANTKNR